MGLFVDRQFEKYSSSSNNTNFVNTNCGQYYGGYSFGHMLLESIPSLFMMGVQQFGESDSTDKADGKGGKTDPAPSTVSPANTDNMSQEEIQQRKDDLNSQLKPLLQDLGANDKDGIEAALINGTDAIQREIDTSTEAAEVKKFEEGQDEYSIAINQIDKKLKEPNLDAQTRQQLESDKVAKNNQRDQAKQAAIDAFNKLKTEKEQEIETLKLKAEQAKAIVAELEAIEKSETNAEIKEKTNDYADFNKARTAFIEKQDETTFKALSDAYANFDNVPQNVTTTMNLLKQKFPNFNWQI